MPSVDDNMLEIVRAFVDQTNRGSVKDELWVTVADPSSFVYVDAFGAAFGKNEADAAFQRWIDKGVQMELKGTKTTHDLFPTLHEVVADIVVSFPEPPFEGVPKGRRRNGPQPSMFTEHGKLVRIVAAASGPNAGELRVRARESTIKEQGGRVEGKELAIKAFHDVSRTMETADVDLICGLMTEDAVLIEPVMIHSGKPAIKSALTSWLGAGMRKASPLSDPVCSMPYHAVGQVSYEFTALPEDAPVEKMPTIGDVAVDVDKNGKIKRFVSIPHDDKSKLWDSKVINWLASKQQGRAHVGGQAA